MYFKDRHEKLSLLSFLASVAILSLLLLLPYYPSAVYALEITNPKSDRHVETAGTGAFFVPAPGLTSAASLDGFESKERRIQVVVANFGAPLNEIAKGFTEETFKSMGMELKSRGEFTVNGARAILFKVLHPSGGTNWGKWIMLAENGDNTITVNAAFVSGDAEAASDLEVMLKGVYMEPPRPASASSDTAGNVSEHPASKDISGAPLTGEVFTQPAPGSRDILVPERKDSIIERGGDVSADAAEPANAGENTGQDGEAASDDADIGGEDAVSSDKSARKTKVRIITENGIVSAEDAPAAAPGGE
jgi:hypothetical protein